MSHQPGAGTILVAEDDDDDFVLMESACAEARVPAELRRVKDGVELLQYLRQEGAFPPAPSPRLILLDLNMPRQDGREALQEMKSDRRLRHFPVVVLSTSRSAEDVVRLYELGANSYISKPVGFRDLKHVMLMIGQYWFRTVELPVVNNLDAAPRQLLQTCRPAGIQSAE